MPFGIGRAYKRRSDSTRGLIKSPGTSMSGSLFGSEYGWSGPLGALIGSVGQVPRLPKAPATPTMGDPAVLAAQEEERRRSLRGRASTILTGPQGLSASPTLSSRSLFGS